jgi:hypothetical protein
MQSCDALAAFPSRGKVVRREGSRLLHFLTLRPAPDIRVGRGLRIAWRTPPSSAGTRNPVAPSIPGFCGLFESRCSTVFCRAGRAKRCPLMVYGCRFRTAVQALDRWAIALARRFTSPEGHTTGTQPVLRTSCILVSSLVLDSSLVPVSPPYLDPGRRSLRGTPRPILACRSQP